MIYKIEENLLNSVIAVISGSRQYKFSYEEISGLINTLRKLEEIKDENEEKESKECKECKSEEKK